MNTRILGDAMAVQRRNDEKIINCVHVKAQRKWNKIVIVTEQCPTLPKLTLIKLASK